MCTKCVYLICVPILVLSEVVCDCPVKGVDAEEIGCHPYDRSPFAVGNVVENFIDLICNRMGQ